MVYFDWIFTYRQTSNIRGTLEANIIVGNSDIVGASPVGAAPTTSSFSTQHLALMDCVKTTARRDEKNFNLGIWVVLYKRFYGYVWSNWEEAPPGNKPLPEPMKANSDRLIGGVISASKPNLDSPIPAVLLWYCVISRVSRGWFNIKMLSYHYVYLISTMGFPILIRQHLCIDSRPSIKAVSTLGLFTHMI